MTQSPKQRLADIFEGMFNRPRNAASTARPCADRRELADWFREFAWECRAAMPRKDDSDA